MSIDSYEQLFMDSLLLSIDSYKQLFVDNYLQLKMTG